MNKNLSGKLPAVLIALGLGFTATATHAGFQFVPATNEAKAPAAAAEPAAPAESVPTEPVDALVLPMPGEENVDALNAAPETAQPTSQTLQVPPGYKGRTEAMGAPAQPEPVLKIKNISPSVPPTETAEPVSPPPAAPENIQAEVQPEPIPLLEAEPTVPTPVQQTELPLPPQDMVEPPVQQQAAEQVPAPAPVVTKTKVIMPQDAPQTAMDRTPNGERLTIQPFPGDAQRSAEAVAPEQQPAPVAEAPAAPSNYASVEGFGADMPLVLALQQVVPAEYAYSFGNGVNPGQTVSWDGGKPWNVVLSDMVRPLNLEVVINGKTVNIRQVGQRADASPALPQDVKRANINDPGEKSQLQAANTLAGIESASGGPEETNAAQPEINAAAPAANEADTLNAAPEQKPAELNIAEIPANLPGSAKQEPGDSTEVQKFEAKSGESLKQTLTRWSEQSGVELIWMASYDYKLNQDVAIEKNFSAAIEDVLASSIDTKDAPAPQVTRNPSDDADGSIVIKDKEAPAPVQSQS